MKKVMMVITALFMVSFAQAQSKVAHVNSGELLQKMPEIKVVETKLAEYQATYEKQLLQMQKDLQEKSAALQEDKTSPKSILAIKQKELEDMYANYQQLQGSAQEDIMEKREELLEPVIKKLKDAIAAVAKEKGYEYVMDSTEGGGMIYGDPKHDLMNDVLKKLGLPATTTTTTTTPAKYIMTFGAKPVKTGPIGIFDSGIGGLTVAREIVNALPNEEIIYFGDTAHLPYGDKSGDAIRYYIAKIADFLYGQGCKALVIACNSASSVLDRASLPPFQKELIINVVDPVVDWVALNPQINTLGVIGTKRTISSGIYARRLKSKVKELQVKNLSTPLLAPMIEEGFYNNNISKAIIASYLEKLVEIDALVLGCTHYPLIKKEIDGYYQSKIPLIDAPKLVTAQLTNQLDALNLRNDVLKPNHKFYVSDYTSGFEQAARLFFGDAVHLEEKNIWI